MQRFLRGGIILLGVVALLTGYMVMFEDRYIYFPSPDIHATPAAIGLDFEKRSFVSTDGVRLHGWYMPHPEARYVILHFHGNAGNISHRLQLYKKWHAMGLAVFGFDYRGYGNSEGIPSEQGFYEDAKAAWSELTKALHIPARDIVLAGRSIGCAVAVQLATEVNAKAVVLETPFTSIPGMARVHYPFLPLRFLVRTKFNSLVMVPRVHMPVLIISAIEDEIAPEWMGRKILEAANEPKQRVSLSGGHNDFDHVSERAYLEAWELFLHLLSPNKLAPKG